MTKKQKEEDQMLGLQLLERDLTYLKAGIDDIKKELLCIKNSKVSKETFDLINQSNQKTISQINKAQDDKIKRIENIVYGALSLALVAIGRTIIDFFVGAK